MDIELKNKLEKIQRRQAAKLIEHIDKKIHLPHDVKNDISRSFYFTISDVARAIENNEVNKTKTKKWGYEYE